MANDPADLSELTKVELYQRARARQIPGRSTMTKSELLHALGGAPPVEPEDTPTGGDERRPEGTSDQSGDQGPKKAKKSKPKKSKSKKSKSKPKKSKPKKSKSKKSKSKKDKSKSKKDKSKKSKSKKDKSTSGKGKRKRTKR